ncbi:MAG: hypothetical protein IJS22_03885 [Lachnospiraceae bacterium]|nr:hypothetical protein [Lachnospiraceae bacterium]
MRFPNGYNGVKKIWIAEVIGLIGGALTLIGALVTAIGAAAGSASVAVGGAVATGAVAIIAAIAGLVAYVINIVGINQAKQDEPGTTNFNTAFILVFVGLGATFLGMFFLGNVFRVISNIASLGVSVFVIKGIQSYAKAYNNDQLISTGNTVLILLVCVTLISIILGFFSSGVLTVISNILSLCQYVVYLVFLTKAKNMLAA